MMRRAVVFCITACALAAVDLYVVNISPYIVAGIAAGWITSRGGQ